MTPVILRERIKPADLAVHVGAYFEGMVKYVVDLDCRIIALGGEMHADGEQLLLDNGSRQTDLWGANYYPGRGPECIEYTSLINIRPAIGNRGMEVQDPAVRALIREITSTLVGNGEPLP